MTENNKKNVSVVGYGYVGKAMVQMLKDHFNVLVYDPGYSVKDNYENIQFCSSIEDLQIGELGIICVPTPQATDGHCDSTAVEESVKKLNTPVIMVKSTVSPGTTEKLKKETGKRIVFSPEYVGESKYYNPYFNNDMKAVPFFIIGGDNEDCNYVLKYIVDILGPTKQYYKTTSLNAEVIKYMENSYFAMKVTFANEFYNICQALGADWYSVREGWLLDPRVERMHTAVFPEKRGFGGKCLPKDTSGIVFAANKAGYRPEFMEAMINSNKKFTDQNN